MLAGQHQQAQVITVQAETTARSLSEESHRARGQAEVAGTLAQAGEVRSPAQVTAALCAIERWPVAVTPVLLLVPSASTTLARMLEEQRPTGTPRRRDSGCP